MTPDAPLFVSQRLAPAAQKRPGRHHGPNRAQHHLDGSRRLEHARTRTRQVAGKRLS